MAASDIRVKLSHEDLERLFVKDGQVSIEVGQGVAEAFSKRYLSEVVKSAAVREAVNDITIAASAAARREAEEKIKAHFEQTGWGYKVELRAEHKAAFEALVRKQITELLDKAILDAYKDLDIPSIVKRRFDAYIDREITSGVSESVREKVRARVRAELEKLG